MDGKMFARLGAVVFVGQAHQSVVGRMAVGGERHAQAHGDAEAGADRREFQRHHLLPVLLLRRPQMAAMFDCLRVDGFLLQRHARLIALHEGLTEAESHALNARLVLILMNHVGDEAVLAEAMSLARSAARVKG